MAKNKACKVLELPPDWKMSFQANAMRSSFCLALTQPMLEFICATADGVHWDRRLYRASWGIAKPDNWLASGGALIKRGLVERIDVRRELAMTDMISSHYRLTPAGKALVELLKITGIFVKADYALEKFSG